MKRILAIDDSEVMRRLYHRMVSRLGSFDVHAARNGAEGLQFLRSTDRVDAILLDLDMPIMNGIEFLRAKQVLPEPCRSVPVVVISGMAQGRTLTAIALGTHSFMVKPIGTKALREVFLALQLLDDTVAPVQEPGGTRVGLGGAGA